MHDSAYTVRLAEDAKHPNATSRASGEVSPDDGRSAISAISRYGTARDAISVNARNEPSCIQLTYVLSYRY